MASKKQITKFPNFTKLNPELKNEYELWFSRFKPYSDFSFNNLVSWLDIKDSLYLAKHQGNMIFLLDNPFNKHPNTYSLLGKSEIDSTIKVIKSQGVSMLEMVPEETVDNISNKSAFEITEDESNNDYIYRFSDWVNWRGGLNKSTKSNIAKVYKNMEQSGIKILPADLSDNGDLKLINDCSRMWQVKNEETKIAKIQLEHTAIKRLLENSKSLNVKALIIKSNNKPISVMIYHEPPQKEFIIFNHLKCDYSFSGIFDFSFMLSVSYLDLNNPNRYKYFNAEQDLGIEGLRHHKKLMNPAYQLKRYTVKL